MRENHSPATSCMPHTENPAQNRGMYPNQELNRDQGSTTEAHKPGMYFLLCKHTQTHSHTHTYTYKTL